jgi:AGCS family alanine or glycine:cation symporter
MLELLAGWIWGPFLSYFYLVAGVLLIILSGAVAFRRVWGAAVDLFKRPASADTGTSSDHPRHISPARGFVTALAASVGVGNVAGVATALHLGGPGALFWIWVSALVGMSFRMCSTWLAQRHQPQSADHPAYATPMAYLEPYYKGSWRWIPVALALLLLVKGFITANLIQSNSVAHALENEFAASHLIVATLMAGAVAAVILGGVKSIVNYSVQISPLMLLVYLGTGMLILLADPARSLAALQQVFAHAFAPYAVAGGAIGYSVMQTIQYGVSRGIFSHGSGLGIAPFLQAANAGDRKQNALLAALVPLVDSLLVCTVTGLVVLSSGLWQEWNGAYLTAAAFEHSLGETGRVLVVLSLVLFAFTTVVNWAYYAERCFVYLGGHSLWKFRLGFIAVTFCGPLFPVKPIWFLGDLLIAAVLLIHLLPLIQLTLLHSRDIQRELDQ